MSKDIKSYNDKKQPHGYWEVYLEGMLFYKCFYVNDKEVGYEEYHEDNYIELAFYL